MGLIHWRDIYDREGKSSERRWGGNTRETPNKRPQCLVERVWLRASYFRKPLAPV